jgi:Bacterial SH3 domain
MFCGHHHEQGHPDMTFVRAAASAAIITLLLVVGATAKPVATTTETNLRKSPGTNSEVVTLIPKGTTVEVGKCTNGWCEASVDGKDGFVIGRNVGMGPRPAPRGGPGSQVVEEEEVVEGPVYARPPGYYRPYPYYGGYYGYYRPWGFGWGWRGGW